MNTVTCTLWTPITANQTIKIIGYGWISRNTNSTIEASSSD